MENANIAPPIPPEYLEQAVIYDEELDYNNKFCILHNFSTNLCFCSEAAECDLFVECKMSNIARKSLNIK